ncbi:MAG TPA: ABC transporter permease [Pyrinomonadaceae bacterium]|jgi:putative ABC transport system permease protein|nr:ABC transporter permease [Pyrinomonadaceae bacterium]
MLDSLLADVRYGIRSLSRKPIVTLVIVIAIAVGVGAGTAVFTVVDGVLIRPLPFHQPEQLTAIWTYNTQQDQAKRYVSYPDFTDWRNGTRSYENMATWYVSGFAMTGTAEPVHVNAAIVSPSLFTVLRAQPLIGTVFDAEEGKGLNSVVLSHNTWKRWFDTDPNVIGRSISLNGASYTVNAVMPPTFQFPIQAEAVDMWVKMPVEQGGLFTRRGARILYAVGRTKPGVTVDQAQADMTMLASGLQQEYPKTNAAINIKVNSLAEELVGSIRPSLLILFGAVGLVLLIVCVTVANLLVADGLTRGGEIALRMALGASRGRIVRQLLTEYILLSLAGGLAGGLLGFLASKFFVSLSPVELPRINEIQLNARVMIFALAVSVLTCLLFGLIPALQASGTRPGQALKDRTLGAGGGSSKRLTQRLLIASQIAVTQVLLIGAGLLVNSFWHMQRAETGLDPNKVLSLKLSLPASYSENQYNDFFQRLKQRLESLPGVERASAVTLLPFSGKDNLNVDFEIEGQPVSESSQPTTSLQVVQPDYFRTMGIRLIGGRDFDERDNADAQGVALINETFAKRYFNGEDPLSKRIKQGPATRTIVGVVGDVRDLGPQKEPRAEMYVPLAQLPIDVMAVVVKTKVEPGSVIPAVRGAIKELDQNLPIYDVQTLNERYASVFARQRFSMTLLAAFAGVAVFLTILGLHGVVSNSVAQRQKEIGIRIALGASPFAILRQVVGTGMIMALIGLAVGSVGAIVLTRFMESLLFGITATDPLTFAATTALLALVALVACYLPARVATQTDPLSVLRAE